MRWARGENLTSTAHHQGGIMIHLRKRQGRALLAAFTGLAVVLFTNMASVRIWANSFSAIRTVLSSDIDTCIHKILHNSISDERQNPYTPHLGDGGIRYASFQMGLAPSKYPPKNQKWRSSLEKLGDLGGTSSKNDEKLRQFWGRTGSPWVATG